MLEQITQFIPFLIPLVIIQLALMITAIIHIVRHNTFRFGNRVVWIIICVLVNIIGPVLYFTIGRGEE